MESSYLLLYIPEGCIALAEEADIDARDDTGLGFALRDLVAH